MRITCPPGEIRPAMSVMRKILFQVLANMLMNRDDEQREDRMNAHKAFDGLSVVDMFSGSGLMALEFISRGATHALAVESDSRKWSTVLANIATLRSGAEKYAKTVFLYKDKVERFIVKHKKTHDIIYCDPPFAYAHKGDLLHKIAASTLIGARSIVVIHSPHAKNSQTTTPRYTRWMCEPLAVRPCIFMRCDNCNVAFLFHFYVNKKNLYDRRNFIQ